MKFRVVENITLKTGNGNVELRKGQIVEVQPEKVTGLVVTGKLQPLPYVTDYGSLIIPSNSDVRYQYWRGGQSVCDTLKELGRCDLIPKYKSIYSDN
jgi:hypothetical protein